MIRCLLMEEEERPLENGGKLQFLCLFKYGKFSPFYSLNCTSSWGRETGWEKEKVFGSPFFGISNIGHC